MPFCEEGLTKLRTIYFTDTVVTYCKLPIHVHAQRIVYRINIFRKMELLIELKDSADLTEACDTLSRCFPLSGVIGMPSTRQLVITEGLPKCSGVSVAWSSSGDMSLSFFGEPALLCLPGSRIKVKPRRVSYFLG